MQMGLSKQFATLVIALALVFPFLLALEKIHESDSLWHLKTGEWILAHGQVPHADFYSSTVPGKPWLDWEWLFQVGMRGVFVAGGFKALVVLKALLVALSGLLIFESCRRNGVDSLLAAATVIVAFVAARERLEMRPDLALLPFAAAFIAVLETARRGNPKWLFCLPLLQAIWVNCHPSFPLGVCLTGAYGLVHGIEFAFKKEWRCCGLIMSVLMLTCAACLVNPYGIHLVQHAMAQTREAGPAGAIGEWQPTMESLAIEPNWALRVFWWLFWLTPVVLIARLFVERRRFPWAHALVMAGMSALALRANRFTAVYAIVMAPILADAVTVLWRKLLEKRQPVPWGRACGTAIVGAFACFVIAIVVTNAWAKWENRTPRFGVGLDEQAVPLKAMVELSKLSPSLGLFNNFPSGGPLIWQCVPPWLVFSDGRANLYGREFMDQYRAALRDSDKWDAWMRERSISVVFIQYGTGDDNVLLQHLAQGTDWTLLYFDHAGCIFTRAGAASTQVPWDDPVAVEQYARHVADNVTGTDAFSWGQLVTTMGNFLMVCGKTDAAERLFNDALAKNPRVSEAWMNLGVIERNRGHFDKALRLANELLSRNPYYYQARLMRAEVEAARGDMEAAVADADAVLWRVPHSAQAWFVRAQLAARGGDRDKAISCLQRVVAERADDATVYWFLAKLLVGQGRINEAVSAYENSLRVWVGAPKQRAQVEAELRQVRAAAAK
jgi:tetratricopeptide (TPR) repeat protein